MSGQTSYLFDEACADLATEELWPSLFESSYLEKEGLVSKIVQGRGPTYFFEAGGKKLVLRHYYRGGLVGKIIKDRYLWLGQQSSRAYREWQILQEARQRGLPAPQPVAMRIARHGMFYSTDLITEEIENAEPLSKCIQERDIGIDKWKGVGQLIRRFHDAGICHQDLNAHNILLKAEKCYLIDFDRACIQAGKAWKQGNLDRLNRSLQKLAGQDSQLYFSQENWDTLNLAYQESDDYASSSSSSSL